MTSIPSLDFVVFYVSDLKASTAWFSEKLGFDYLPEQSGPQFSQLKSGNGPNFGLVLASAQTPPAGTVEVYFKSDNLPSLRESVISRGVEATEIAHPPFGDIFSVYSADGQIVTMLAERS